ncbi:GPI mannosyltransferase 3 [Magnaporthiopsis poae ATCC 64411]|uniref:Mannosyltransferase n=1 Tax=Magnaporthiopsis poae (strain ATCC 64411 / 73-15) TaxID=644358 RepID=A0A0C4E668_MAGP6|nr:GPI mannosyltransferase 3 [Magnaporthiopsis poae ATCC 64411]
MEPPGGAATFALLLAWRLANAFCVRTFFQPDEYFQALEPAWSVVFGPDSGAWLTWEWQYQLRSSLHPLLFAGLYLGLDSLMQLLKLPVHIRANVLVAAPTALQAVFAALGDFYTWKLALNAHGHSRTVAAAALWMSVLNPWQWYCSTRTFSNSIETTLTAMALAYWPWGLLGAADAVRGDKPADQVRPPAPPSTRGLRKSLLLAAVAVILRPTNILIWLAIVTLMLTRFSLDGASPLTPKTVISLAIEAVLCGSSVLVVSLLSDRFYFGFWTFPPFQWLHFNLTQALAVFYGRNDWHYYLSQGLPLLTTTFLPFALMGLYKSTGLATSSNAVRALSFAVFATIGALSTITHKEVRFIYPLLPILDVIAAPHVCSYFLSEPTSSTSTSASPRARAAARPILKRKALLATLLGINVTIAGVLSVLHQPAVLSVLNFLRGEYENLNPGGPALRQTSHGPSNPSYGNSAPGLDEPFVLFLTPCHSTPWRSHLVYPGLQARALTCEPPLHTQPGTRERDEYMTEADRFYANPDSFLAGEMWPGISPSDASQIPRYIVGFEGIQDDLLRFFDSPTGSGAGLAIKPRRVWEGWNGFFNEDPQRRGKLVVWKMDKRVGTSPTASS